MNQRDKQLKQYSRDLRKTMTLEERCLWYQFLASHQYRFKRQTVIEDYILDFYCPKLHLAIELDGSQHFHTEQYAYDLKRTKLLRKKNIQILRFTNQQIQNNLQAVCNEIDKVISQIEEGTPLIDLETDGHVY